MSKESAVRAVRTATVGAQNAGRQDQLEEAAEKGVKVEKRWIAAHDFRTRAEHAHRDGMHIPIDQEWTSGLMFPADPNGPPHEVYNCRCSQRSWFPEVAEFYTRETYEEWYNRKVEELGEDGTRAEFKKFGNNRPYHLKAER